MNVFRFELNPSWENLPRCNSVLNGTVRTRPYLVNSYQTTLCVKSVARGSAWYSTRRGRYLVDAETFLVINHGQEYSLEIAAGSDTETICPFFQPGFLGHVAGCLKSGPDRLLDEPSSEGEDPEFFERLYPMQAGPVAARLKALHGGLRGPGVCRPWLEDQLYGLAGDLLVLRKGVQREVAAFPGSRPSTREELYRRLHRARDYIDSCFAQHLSVAQVARVACLSPYHFHRTFCRAFGETPMRHLQARRLRAACHLLSATDRSVTSIGLEVGFESLGTFSWLFRKRFGLSPREFRSRHRRR
jgi:AraC family transcriptional regulator